MATLTYAGIGARATPAAVLADMAVMAGWLARTGWHLSSGGADGADSAFAAGAPAGHRVAVRHERGLRPQMVRQPAQLAEAHAARAVARCRSSHDRRADQAGDDAGARARRNADADRTHQLHGVEAQHRADQGGAHGERRRELPTMSCTVSSGSPKVVSVVASAISGPARTAATARDASATLPSAPDALSLRAPGIFLARALTGPLPAGRRRRPRSRRARARPPRHPGRRAGSGSGSRTG